MKNKPLTDDELRSLTDSFAYNAETGDFVWAKKTCRKCVVGAVAGRTKPDGYKTLRNNYTEYYAHRIAWAMFHGPIPDGMEVDHIDGNPSNNLLSNLRLATRSQNSQNKGKAISSNITSGLLGVSLHKASGLWRARIKFDGLQKSLGYFKSKEAAFEAYKAAKTQHHFVGALA